MIATIISNIAVIILFHIENIVLYTTKCNVIFSINFWIRDKNH